MIGSNFNTPAPLNPRGLDSLYTMGLRCARVWVNGTDVIKAPDAYDFKQLTINLQHLRNAGFWTYVNWGYVPAFMSEGLPAYYPLGCWVPWLPGDPEPDLDHNPNNNWRFARPDEKPYCHMPLVPHIDPEPVERFTYALASELADLIDYFGGGNEGEMRDFWPPIADVRYKEVGYTRYMTELLIPSARGYRNGSTGGAAIIVGPESATANGLRMILELERELGAGRVFDVLSGHLYPWNGQFPGDSFERAGQFLKVIDDLGDGRPFWDTECDAPVDQYDKNVPWLAEMDRLYGDRIRAHMFGQPGQWFEGGEQAWLGGQFTPNARWQAMYVYTRERGTLRRRAVRK